MEKVLLALWKSDAVTGDTLRGQLLALAPEMEAAPGVRGLRLAVADSAVAAAAARRMEGQPPLPDALVSLWVDSAAQSRWHADRLEAIAIRQCSYLVSEAEPLINQAAHPTPPGERMYGMCQVVFLSPPADMPRDQFLAVWKDSHTQVAVDTQSTFGYRQNLVVQNLHGDVLPCEAIVEENFPPEAMASDHAFYDSGGDEALLQSNQQAMIASCSRFIDLARINVVPMSEYPIRLPAVP
ncbi:MAG: hypothetical protein AAGA91_00715 [Pseudomonadota bacterium]